MTDELTTSNPSPGSGFRLVDTGSKDEFLVRRQGSADLLAAAIIRSEPDGVFAYPHQSPYRRLGPFASAAEALHACRSALSEADDRAGESGGA